MNNKKEKLMELVNLYDELDLETHYRDVKYIGTRLEIMDINSNEADELTELINNWEKTVVDDKRTALLEKIKGLESNLYNKMVEERKYRCGQCFEEITDKEEIELAKNGVGVCNHCY